MDDVHKLKTIRILTGKTSLPPAERLAQIAAIAKPKAKRAPKPKDEERPATSESRSRGSATGRDRKETGGQDRKG
jgi:hypothetical protein